MNFTYADSHDIIMIHWLNKFLRPVITNKALPVQRIALTVSLGSIAAPLKLRAYYGTIKSVYY